MENKERLRQIADAKSLTADDKKFIRDLSAEMGVAFAPKGGCKNCYIDQAVKLWKAMQEPAKRTGKYTLKAGVDVIFNRTHRVNAATMTDELAERLIAQGFPTEYFDICE